MNFHQSHTLHRARRPRRLRASDGFTLAEVLVSASLIAIAFGSVIWGLNRMNQTASISRNYSGAYTTALKRIDWFLSAGPFNPQKSQIPQDSVSTCTGGDTYCSCSSQSAATVSLSPGTYTECVAIYNDPPMLNGLLQLLNPTDPPTFGGKMTTVIADVSPTPGSAPFFYRVTVTVEFKYRNTDYTSANGKAYSISTVRTSDQ